MFSMSALHSDIAHDLRQPLNVIALVAANLRERLSGALTQADFAYLESKLDRIENQLAKAIHLIDALSQNDQLNSDIDLGPR